LALVLFGGVVSSAVWRAYRADQLPPTPTVPANLEANMAYVSEVSGSAESVAPGETSGRPLSAGETVGAGEGSLVRTGPSSSLRLALAEGAAFFLADNTEVELRQLAYREHGVEETILQLNDGRALVSGDDEVMRVAVFVETGARAETTTGLMGLAYDRTSQRLDVYCFTGPCAIVGRNGERVELESGESGWVQGFDPPGLAGFILPLLFEFFMDLGDAGLIASPTATPRGQRVMATATTSRPSPTPVRLTPTEPRPTFTPQPAQSSTPTDESQPAATATPLPALTATTTAVPATQTVPPATATDPPLPSSTPPPASATPAATATGPVITTSTPPPTATTPPATATPSPTPAVEPTASTATPVGADEPIPSPTPGAQPIFQG
jgi:hypothetical protein